MCVCPAKLYGTIFVFNINKKKTSNEENALEGIKQNKETYWCLVTLFLVLQLFFLDCLRNGGREGRANDSSQHTFLGQTY